MVRDGAVWPHDVNANQSNASHPSHARAVRLPKAVCVTVRCRHVAFAGAGDRIMLPHPFSAMIAKDMTRERGSPAGIHLPGAMLDCWAAPWSREDGACGVAVEAIGSRLRLA